jgi:hypothetical protein
MNVPYKILGKAGTDLIDLKHQVDHMPVSRDGVQKSS